MHCIWSANDSFVWEMGWNASHHSQNLDVSLEALCRIISIDPVLTEIWICLQIRYSSWVHWLNDSVYSKNVQYDSQSDQKTWYIVSTLYFGAWKSQSTFPFIILKRAAKIYLTSF